MVSIKSVKKFEFCGVRNINGSVRSPKNGLKVNDNCKPIKANNIAQAFKNRIPFFILLLFSFSKSIV